MPIDDLEVRRDPGLSALLSGLDGSPASYMSAAREIEANTSGDDSTPLSVGIASTFTADLVKPYLVVEGARRGFRISTVFAPFNQLEQQLLDPQSAFYRSKPDIIVLAARLEEISPNLVHGFMTLSADTLETEILAVMNRFQNLTKAVRTNTSASILIFNQAEPLHLAAGMADSQLAMPQRTIIHQLNEKLAELCRRNTDVFIFDYARLLTELGLNSQDLALWYMARIPFSSSTQIEIGKRLARYIRALRRPACKCLVLDLDNTLWGGILAEDGMAGIRIGDDYPGRVFKDFQRYLLTLRDRGILLAIASKNNEADVLAVFDRNKELVLKLQDFSARQIHWDDKAKSLAAIAKDLHIGTEALAFFDDQAVEREWIRSRMPEVTVIDMPGSPLGFARAMEESGAFDQLVISDEDKFRGSSFQIEHRRNELEKESESIEDFLRKLGISIHVGQITPETLPRVAQLIGKTNQFNLTSRRYTSSELQHVLDAGAKAFWLRVEDRLENYGIVGAALAMADPKESRRWRLDLFLISCRVLGRQIETAFLSALSHWLRGRGVETLIGEYIPTPKNAPAADFYQKLGFQINSVDGHLWTWNLLNGEIPIPPFITLNDGEFHG